VSLGPEWDRPLLVLGLVAALLVLAAMRWWAGLVLLVGTAVALAVVVYLDD
jgi:hypothetical protein